MAMMFKLLVASLLLSTVASLECYRGFVKYASPLYIKSVPEDVVCVRVKVRGRNEEHYHGMEYYPDEKMERLLKQYPGKEFCTTDVANERVFDSCYCSGNRCNIQYPKRNLTKLP